MGERGDNAVFLSAEDSPEPAVSHDMLGFFISRLLITFNNCLFLAAIKNGLSKTCLNVVTATWHFDCANPCLTPCGERVEARA